MAARELARHGTKAGSASPSVDRMPAALAGKYRPLFVLGRGGMGSVEAALSLDPSDEGGGARASEASATAAEPASPVLRVVALKRLLPEAARDLRRVEMFLREARLAAMLDHPNVVRAYDYGEIEGELYLTMEYVEGQPLSRVLRVLADSGKRLDAALVAHLLAEVCEGLHAAHELRDDEGQPLNVVHRDVSPQNVMLGYDGRVRLLDFGVAKIEAESVTKTGEVKGKTAYMSPEQAMGDAVDRRSDLFGVGAVLFECLTLRRMWGDGTDMDVIRKLALEQPPRLDDAVPSAPPEMCALYTRLVARSANDRPASARDVAEELRDVVRLSADTAARALRAVLDEHFGSQAADQRQKLVDAIESIDGSRSVRPSSTGESTPPPRISFTSHRPSFSPPTPTTPPATTAVAATTGSVAAPPKRSLTPFVVGTLGIAVAFGAWRTWGATPASTTASSLPAMASAGLDARTAPSNASLSATSGTNVGAVQTGTSQTGAVQTGAVQTGTSQTGAVQTVPGPMAAPRSNGAIANAGTNAATNGATPRAAAVIPSGGASTAHVTTSSSAKHVAPSSPASPPPSPASTPPSSPARPDVSTPHTSQTSAPASTPARPATPLDVDDHPF